MKDKTWAKCTLDNIIKNHKSFPDKTDWNEGYIMGLIESRELLNELEDRETLSPEWIDENATLIVDGMISDKFVRVNRLKNILIPKN